MSSTVPEGWAAHELGALAQKIEGGGTPSRSEPKYWNGDIPWATVKDLRGVSLGTTEEFITRQGLENSSSKLVPANTMIIASRMAVGKAVHFNQSVAINQDLKAFYPKKSLSWSFLLQWYLSKNEQIASLATGSTVKGIRLDDLKLLPINLPPLPEQQKIATILSSVDNVIETTRAQIGKLKDLKTGMMQELLTKGIGSGGVPHTEFKDSPVGRIPAGWECMKLEDVSERIWIGLVTTMTKHYVEQGVLLVRNSDIKEFSFRYKGMINLAPQFAEDNHSRGFEIGDIATVHTGDVGTSAVIDQRLQGAQGFATINTRVNLSLATPEFVAEMLNSPVLGGQIKKVVTGDGRDNLNLKDFVKLLIPIPNTLDEQRRIHWAIDSVRMKLTGLSEKLEVMTNTKKALMQDLLTGKVRVKIDQKESAVA